MVVLPTTDKNTDNTHGWSEFLRVFSMCVEYFPEIMESNHRFKMLI